MGTAIEEEKRKLALKKSRIEAKEKFLRDKERKVRTRRLIELGGLISKAGIEDLNNTALLGALLEIKDKLKEESTVKKWKDKGDQAFKKVEEEKGDALVLIFDVEPEKATKSQLRGQGFAWNRFRKEWYGYGHQSELQKAFPGVKIERVE